MSSPITAPLPGWPARLFVWRFPIGVAAGVLLLATAGANAGKLLVVDAPVMSDVILVLGGDDHDRRYNTALRLLNQGYANSMIVDADDSTVTLGNTAAGRLNEFVNRTAGAMAARISVCPMVAHSTLEETGDAARCLSRLRARRVLLVTSDYHTRRALSIFRERIPKVQFSAAAVPDGAGDWLENGNATVSVLGEWLRLLWWGAIERWLTAG